MQLPELKKLLKVLREAGVTKYEASDLKLELEAVTPEAGSSPTTSILEDAEPSQEDLLFYSVQQAPPAEDQ